MCHFAVFQRKGNSLTVNSDLVVTVCEFVRLSDHEFFIVLFHFHRGDSLTGFEGDIDFVAVFVVEFAGYGDIVCINAVCTAADCDKSVNNNVFAIGCYDNLFNGCRCVKVQNAIDKSGTTRIKFKFFSRNMKKIDPIKK